MGVANLLASVAQPTSAPASAEPEADIEAGEGEEIEAPEGEAPEGEEGEADPEAAEGEEADPEAEAEEAEKSRLRQEDYTRKTQALAEERKRLHAELEQEREQFAQKEEDFNEVFDWVKSLKDPEQAEFELQRYFPQTIQALKDKWLLESQEEGQLTERERAAARRVREMEQRERERAADEAAAKKRHDKEQQAKRTADLRKKMSDWLPAAAKAAGLDQDDDMYQLIKNELGNGRYYNRQWSADVITEAAKVVAKALKKGTPLAPPAKPEAKLPPSPKGPGQKTPPGAKIGKKPAPKQDIGKGFRAIREKYGV